MKKTQLLSALFLSLVTASPALGAAKTYQVTGPIVEVNDETITIEKGKEKWQIDRTKDTKVTGELKPGAKVTVQYRMSADAIDVKGGAKEAKAAKDTKDVKDAKDSKDAKPAEAKAPEAPKAEPAKPAAAKAEPAKATAPAASATKPAEPAKK
jgi:hypothetical protein